jgi:hypothetical protein
MGAVDRPIDSGSGGEPAMSLAALEVSPGQAWELVETGRYRPLRIRGSFPGRELG